MNEDDLLKLGFIKMPESEYSMDTYEKGCVQIWNKKRDFSDLNLTAKIEGKIKNINDLIILCRIIEWFEMLNRKQNEHTQNNNIND